jgi:hypothetical protein
MQGITGSLRRDLLTYLLATSSERAELLAQLCQRRPEMADLLAELEADEDLRARFEIALLKHA